MLELAAHPNIAGIKQAVAALDLDTLELLAGAPAGFAVLGGEDPFLFPLVCMGGAGRDLRVGARVHRAVRRDDRVRARGQGRRRARPRRGAAARRAGAFAEPNPAVFKGVLHAQGRIPTPDVRLPLMNASAPAVDRASRHRRASTVRT